MTDRNEEPPLADDERPARGRRRPPDSLRQWQGRLTDDDFDLLDHEEEFQTFQPIPRGRRREREG